MQNAGVKKHGKVGSECEAAELGHILFLAQLKPLSVNPVSDKNLAGAEVVNGSGRSDAAERDKINLVSLRRERSEAVEEREGGASSRVANSPRDLPCLHCLDELLPVLGLPLVVQLSHKPAAPLVQKPHQVRVEVLGLLDVRRENPENVHIESD